jgi:serine/threonine-protein kinase RsbW
VGTSTRTLDSTIGNIDLLEGDTIELARSAGFLGDELERVGIAVREAVANAIIHGNRLVRTPEQFKVVVSDQGRGFDVNCLPEPGSPEVLLRESGRGMRAVCQSVGASDLDRMDAFT